MKTVDLISIIESVLPQDLVVSCPQNSSPEKEKHFNDSRNFLLEKAARSYFNLVIRPIIEKQIEFRDLNNDTPFKSDWLYDKSTMEKYMDMLEPDDVLHEKYRLLCENDNLDSLKDHGLV